MPFKPKELPDVNKPKTRAQRFWGEVLSYIIITIGTAIIALGIYLFKFPNHFSVGGVSSLAVLLSELLDHAVTESQIMSIANIALLIVALIVFGKSFAIKTVYSTVLLSGLTLAFEWVIPPSMLPLTNELFLELILTIAAIAVGSAILFSQGASSGGTDVIAMLIRKFTNADIGTALLITDAFMAFAGIFVFGPTIGLYSILGLVLKSFIVDNVIDGMNRTKVFIIVTQREKEACDFINNILHRGATVSKCTGSYTNEEKSMIITVLTRMQAGMLKKYLKEVDPQAFTVITNSSDIIGKGFRIVN